MPDCQMYWRTFALAHLLAARLIGRLMMAGYSAHDESRGGENQRGYRKRECNCMCRR